MNTNMYLFILMLIGGLFFIGLAIRQNMKAKKAEETWLTTTGVVLSSTVKVQRSRNTKGQTRITYIPQVSYQYQVGDQTYTGDRLGFGSGSYGQAKANQKSIDYPQGGQVIVHYDPADPAKAVLETKAQGAGTFIVLGIILLAMGVLGMYVFLR
jgi:hypothetical protein